MVLREFVTQAILDIVGAIEDAQKKTPVGTVAFNPGSTNIALVQRYMSGTDADVLICGEPGEWDAGEYVRDSAFSGKKKGMIVL